MKFMVYCMIHYPNVSCKAFLLKAVIRPYLYSEDSLNVFITTIFMDYLVTRYINTFSVISTDCITYILSLSLL